MPKEEVKQWFNVTLPQQEIQLHLHGKGKRYLRSSAYPPGKCTYLREVIEIFFSALQMEVQTLR